MYYVKFIIMVIISIDKLEYIYLIDYTSYSFSKYYAFRIEFSFFYTENCPWIQFCFKTITSVTIYNYVAVK